MAFDATKPHTGQTYGESIDSARANDADLDARLRAHLANVAEAHGLDAVLLAIADYTSHKANAADAHGIDRILVNVAALLAEVSAARGGKTALADRLANALNADGSIRLSTLNNKWINNSDTPTYIDATHFSVPGDRTKVYIAGVQLRLTVSGTYAYAPVASCSYGGGVTTITLDPAYQVLTAGLSVVDLGLIAWDNAVANAVTQALTQIADLQGKLTSIQNMRAKAVEPTVSDLPTGQIGVWKNTTSGAVKLWVNDGGILKSTALA